MPYKRKETQSSAACWRFSSLAGGAYSRKAENGRFALLRMGYHLQKFTLFNIYGKQGGRIMAATKRRKPRSLTNCLIERK